MILVLVQFAVAVLAALGLESVWRRSAAPGDAAKGRGAKGRKDARGAGRDRGVDPGAGWMRGAFLAGGGAIVAVVLLQLFSPAILAVASKARQWMNEASARQALDLATLDAVKSGILLAAGCAVIAFHLRGRLTRGAAALLLIGITAIDLWPVDRKIIDPLLGSPKEYAENFAETPEVTFLRSDSTQFRVLPIRWDDSRLAAFGIASVLGYHPAKPRLYQAFTDTVGIASLGVARLLNVKYVLSEGYPPADNPDLTLRHDGAVKVYEVRGALPRAFVVHRIRRTLNDSSVLATLRTEGSFDPATEALWAGEIPPPPVSMPAERDSVRTLRYDFNEVEYMVATAAPGLLVTIEQYDPDWTATVDGATAEIHRVNYLMRGVALPAGVHRVRYVYQPRALQAGIRISALSASITLLLAAAGFFLAWRRRSGAAAAAARAAKDAAP
jgi:hypothetical protein